MVDLDQPSFSDPTNITNPLFGYLATEVNELDILELNAKRGAVSAAAGRAQGFVSNAVTKSGTNRFTGSYRFEAIPSEWVKESRTGVRSITDRWVNAGSVGIPYEGRRGAYWALLGPDVDLRRTEYDTEAAVDLFRGTGYPGFDELAGWLLEPPDPDETSEFFEANAG